MKVKKNYVQVKLNWREKMIDENLSCNEIRIFAMSKDEPRFVNKTYSYVQREFFLNDLVNEKGKFLYYRNGINISGDTLVLFKFDNQIIASAIVKKSEKELEVRHGVDHKGTLYIDISTIEVFKPISISKLLKEIPNLRYSTRGNKIPVENLDIIIQLINKNIDNKNY